MIHFSLYQYRNDFHIDMRVNPESLALFHEIVIKGNKSTEGTFQWMIIITEAEKEIASQPSDIFPTSVSRRKELTLHPNLFKY